MNRANWKYINKGLIIILSLFVVASITSIIFLSQILLKLDSLITQGGQNVGTALALKDLYINLDDAETSVRGYIITKDDRFITSYQAAMDKVPDSRRRIEVGGEALISTEQLARLDKLTAEKVVILQQAAANRAAEPTDVSSQPITRGRGTAVMDQIRDLVNTVSQQNLSAIAARQDQSKTSLQQALAIAVAVMLCTLGICLLLVWYFQRSILRERALESTKNEFLSLASHQLRTPATNVKQYVGLLLDGYLGDLTEKQQDALRIAYKNNESEIRIMNDLLDIAKLDLKRIRLHKKSVNIVSIVRQVVKSFEDVAGSKRQELVYKAPDELMAQVDRAYFKGVVEKLVDNAIRYSKDDTRIVVKVRALESQGMFEVSVRDRGAGIKKRELTNLFMKFSRLKNEFSANSEGSGLGLYWVKQIMNLHGGTIEVISKEGQGSKFIARSPIK